MQVDLLFHFPPELFNLLVDTIPRLNKGKRDLFSFFEGAGVPRSLMQTPLSVWQSNNDAITKFDITRQILTALNSQGERCLRERREVLRRVVEFDNFSACWESDQLKAKGLVAEIRTLVNVKDSFTRMNNEFEAERKANIDRKERELATLQEQRKRLDAVQDKLNRLFFETNPRRRGKQFEGVLNELCAAYGIAVRQAFELRSADNGLTLEQIDGVIEVSHHLYFVEAKWWEDKVGVPQISEHMMRVFLRAEARALIISASDFTIPAVEQSKAALQQKTVVLVTLREIIQLLDTRHMDLPELIWQKTNAAIIDKNPYFEPLAA